VEFGPKPGEKQCGDQHDTDQHQREYREDEPAGESVAARFGDGAFEKLVVAAVGAPRDIEQVAEQGNGTDGGLDQDVEHHASEHDIRNATDPCRKDDDGGRETGDDVSGAGDEADDAVETETDGGSGDVDEVVEQVREDVEVLVAEGACGGFLAPRTARREDFCGGDGFPNWRHIGVLDDLDVIMRPGGVYLEMIRRL